MGVVGLGGVGRRGGARRATGARLAPSGGRPGQSLSFDSAEATAALAGVRGRGAGEGGCRGGGGGGGRRVRGDIRSVTHRYFNPELRGPADLAGVEIEMRERLRQLLERGHVAVTARWIEGPSAKGGVAVDLSRAKQVLGAAQQLKKKLELKGTGDVAFVAPHPDVLA